MSNEPETINVSYTNWRGETSVRRVLLGHVRFGTSEWHKEPTWLINVFDLDHPAQIWKEFDLAKCDFNRAILPTTDQIKADHAALEAVERARDEALVEAAGLSDGLAVEMELYDAIPTTTTRSKALCIRNRILALRTKPTPSVEPVTVHAIPSNILQALDDLPEGPWVTHTSCSFRRISKLHGTDGGVLHACKQRSDGHLDLSWTEKQCRAICTIVNALRAIAGGRDE